MYQDCILHMQSLERSYLFHHVDVLGNTHLAKILGEGKHPVNSMHHQAVRDLGENLRVSAVAPDGTIEAIESIDGQIVAVQWHPEFSHKVDENSRKIFRAFVKAAAGDGISCLD